MYYIVRPRDPLQSIENKAFPKLSFGFKAFYAYPISPSLLSQYLLYIVLFSRAAPLEVKKKGIKILTNITIKPIFISSSLYSLK